MVAPARIIPIILAGGTGTRLWPLSRESYPKQFLALLSDTESLLQRTLKRFSDTRVYAPPIIIGNQQHRFIIAEQVRQRNADATILLEPVAKNTSASVAIAALYAEETATADAILLMVPADHAIQDEAAFHNAVSLARKAGEAGALATLGITPDKAETGYGYIKVGAPYPDAEGVHQVACFVEKPDAQTAQFYLTAGDYLWNAGIFLGRADAFLNEFQALAPDILQQAKAALRLRQRDLDFIRLDAKAFEALPAISVDYAIMEKTTRAAVVPVQMQWSDVGSWASLADLLPSDAAGNVCRGGVITQASTACYIHTEKALVATLGVDNLVIVNTKDALLVAHKDQAQNLKKLVDAVNAAGHAQAVEHRLVHRPWGSYEGIDEGERYQVKRIVVKPQQKLSLQKHFHRAEHWVVVKGSALVTRDNEQLLLKEDESVYLPLGCVHRLENPGKIPLIMVEVQSGSYLGEDDIVRFDDTYGRVAG